MAVRVTVRFDAEKDLCFIRDFELPDVETVLGIKEYLEENYQVPVCMQTLYHGGATLRDDTTVASLRLRNGDKFVLAYYATAEIEETRIVISWLETLVTSIKEGGAPEVPYDCFEQDMLGAELFFPYEKPQKRANKDLFVASGGLTMLLQVYDYLTKCPWRDLPGELRLFELNVMSGLFPLARTFAYREAIVKEGAIKMCQSSLLRVKIQYNQKITDPSAPEDQRHAFEYMLLGSTKLAIALLAW